MGCGPGHAAVASGFASLWAPNTERPRSTTRTCRSRAYIRVFERNGGAGDQVTNRVRRKDFARLRLSHDPGCHAERRSAGLSFQDLALPGVESRLRIDSER